MGIFVPRGGSDECGGLCNVDVTFTAGRGALNLRESQLNASNHKDERELWEAAGAAGLARNELTNNARRITR